MNNILLKVLILYSFHLHICYSQFVALNEQYWDSNELQLQPRLDDTLDLRNANWKLVINWLMQRQQIRLCVAILRYDKNLIRGTLCENLLANQLLMANCDIGNIEDLSMIMRNAFGSSLFDTMQKCRPGLELFGVRCRRRA
ncbi:uncharacterized protein Dwil_GK18927 [Drosophila willistoni]|uniref:Uncharacterized protein n=1 Tax=Drosophila willistoni TaxID=7260 RepID=B4NLN5_DROWI|nr:uncharacterized protein LOC6651816 [Drosophila willistoni]EDW85274.1 uncharacterized protein Dwil_GK18927 [Drosophila willistoni]